MPGSVSFKISAELLKLFAEEKRIVFKPETIGVPADIKLLKKLIENEAMLKNFDVFISPKAGR